MKKVSKASVLLAASMNPFDVLAICKDIAANKLGYGIISRVKSIKFSAPKKTEAEWVAKFNTPFNIVKVVKVTNARAYDYVKAVNRQLAKQGSKEDFIGDKMKGFEWLVKPILKSSLKEGIADKDRMQMCVTYTDADKTKFESVYIVGGDHFATKEELDFINAHLYKAPSRSRKQEAVGIAEENIIQTRNFIVSNVAFCGKSDEVTKYWDALMM